MVSLCSVYKELDFLPADAYAARITALFETYGAGYDFASFWVQRIDGRPTAAISRVDGNMTLCCAENADFEELACFISTVGYSSLTLDAAFLGQLGLTASKTSYTVRYEGEKLILNEEILDDYDKKSLYDLLGSCGFELGNYSDFLSDVCARLNKGTASLAAIENETLDACAFALFKGEKSVLLGAVATRNEARGKGYASTLVRSLAGRETERKVYLFCRNDSLLEFYKKSGFVFCGKWAIVD
ncbi:MAG: GNAT family N-acetyltransferase [Clostridia bacterium]|nr:GNAT family N-acetyltransferase [Clostridia bacterium]